MKKLLENRLVLTLALVLSVVAELLFCAGAQSQAQNAVIGNRPAASIQSWQPAAPDMLLHMTAVLGLRNTAQLAKLKDQLQQPASPRYHQWLSSAQFAQQFGPTSDQMQAVANWLQGSGFTVDSADLGMREVRFSGSVAQVQQVLGTAIVSNGSQYANLSDPQIPSAMTGSIVAFFGLSSFNPNPTPSPTPGAGVTLSSPAASVPGSNQVHFSPQDFWTFYDESNPTLQGANGGTLAPDCIALLEVATLPTVPTATGTATSVPSPTPTASVLDVFTSQFSIPATQIQIVLTSPDNPPAQPDDNEPPLDVDWADSVAPNTPILLYVSTIPDTTTPAFDTLALAVSQNLCGVISSSIDDEGSKCPDLAQVQAYAQTDAQAVVQGQTLFHSSGDYGSFYPCGQPGTTPGETGIQPSIEESSASSDVTVVGGTQFTATYDSNNNNTSVLGPGIEQVWQEYSPSPISTPTPAPEKGTSGGGISVVFPAPVWQQNITPYGLSAPLTMRGVPDVSAGASPDLPGYWIATTNALASCKDDAVTCFLGDGGTSASSPIWAGISRLIAQSLNTTRLGNINPQLYQVVAANGGALVDVSVLGNNCTFADCTPYTGYQVGPGYDLGTGLGSPDINKLIAAFQPPTPTPSPSATPTAAPTSTATTAPTATATAAPTATATAQPTGTPIAPTPTPVPGAQASASNITSTGISNQTVPAGSLSVTNTSASTEMIAAVTVDFSDPSIFSNLILTGTAGGITRVAMTGTLGASTVFTFSPAVSVPAGAVASFTLTGTLSTTTARAGRTVLYAGLIVSPGRLNGLPLGLAFGMLGMALLVMPPSRRRRVVMIAGLIMLLAASQIGCSGSSSSNTTVLQSSQQQVPAGGVAATNAQGPVQVLGLPATISTVELLS